MGKMFSVCTDIVPFCIVKLIFLVEIKLVRYAGQRLCQGCGTDILARWAWVFPLRALRFTIVNLRFRGGEGWCQFAGCDITQRDFLDFTQWHNDHYGRASRFADLAEPSRSLRGRVPAKGAKDALRALRLASMHYVCYRTTSFLALRNDLSFNTLFFQYRLILSKITPAGSRTSAAKLLRYAALSFSPKALMAS